MTEDPIVEEIRKYRAEHAARYDNDLNKICEALRAQEKMSHKKIVTLPPRLLQPKRIAANKANALGRQKAPLVPHSAFCRR